MLAQFPKFCQFFFLYLKRKTIVGWIFFERNKNIIVRLFTIKRGRYNRPILHLSTMGVLGIGVVVSPFLADTYPIFSTKAANSLETSSLLAQASIIVGENVFETNISKKPRDKIITYKVQKGDTLSTIAEKFSSPDNAISVDTIRWANDLKNDNISIGDELKILPVTGIAHKVERGGTVYSIAKKFSTEAQKIVDFPFNDFANPETFSLVEGQILIVPDGIKPSEQPVIKRQVYIAQGPITVYSSGFTWPLRGAISQFASWYHMALDLTSPVGTPIVAAHSGTVTRVSVGTWDGGYGTSVRIDNGFGTESNYAHLGGVNVKAGDTVEVGKTVIGWVGMTGRTTGAHVHFEIRKNGALVNPLSYLQ